MERRSGARATKLGCLALTAGLLPCLLSATASTERATAVPGPMASILAPLPAPRAQDWFGAPVVPEFFRSEDPQEEAAPLDDPLPRRGPRMDPSAAEREWGKGLTALDLQAWQREDDLRVIREWMGETLLGVPLLLPQLALEAFVPRGFRVGPTTFLYRSTPGSASLVLVVVDQMLFHEAEFLSHVQEWSDDLWLPEEPDISRGQRRVLRRSFMSGLRATYAMPGMTLGLMVETASDNGPAGLLLLPPLAGGLLWLKGIDQRFDLDDVLRFRVKLAPGRVWFDKYDSNSGAPVLSFEVKIGDFPVGLLGTFEISLRGMEPAFIGIGTSLGTVERLLGREERRDHRVE